MSPILDSAGAGGCGDWVIAGACIIILWCICLCHNLLSPAWLWRLKSDFCGMSVVLLDSCVFLAYGREAAWVVDYSTLCHTRRHRGSGASSLPMLGADRITSSESVAAQLLIAIPCFVFLYIMLSFHRKTATYVISHRHPHRSLFPVLLSLPSESRQ